MRKLMPLRLPSGWALIFNIFVEFPSDEPPTAKEVSMFYSEDILSAQRIRHTEQGWEVDISNHVIDLGWHPSGDSNGTYRLSLVQNNWDDVHVQFEHRNCYVIQKAMDTVTRMLSEGKNPEFIARVLADPRFPNVSPRLPGTHFTEP